MGALEHFLGPLAFDHIYATCRRAKNDRGTGRFHAVNAFFLLCAYPSFAAPAERPDGSEKARNAACCGARYPVIIQERLNVLRGEILGILRISRKRSPKAIRKRNYRKPTRGPTQSPQMAKKRLELPLVA